MFRYALSRVAVAAGQCFAVLVAVFALTSLLPGDTADVLIGEQGTEEQAALVRARLGLDQPLVSRFGSWLHAVLQGDFGRSLVTGLPVTHEVTARLGTTALLAGCALAVVVPLALLLGVASGLREGSWIDRALNGATVLLHAVPEFVLGLLLVAWLSLGLGLLPATAAGTTGAQLPGTPQVLVLPVGVLVSRQLCDLARQVRIGVAERKDGPMASHLRLLGLDEHRIVVRHVVPNALAPAVQQLARCVDGLLGGAVVVESLFAVSGLGTGFVEAVQNRDLPAVQCYALVFALTAVAVNLLADLAVHRLVPVREGRA
ncbi:ABC transporter permease [Streptomyces diacarni]|uniref:ABC transporter permease n=1 Tax=Streptomyces diacarni TaxID=2800381 RepID=UPI00340F17E1